MKNYNYNNYNYNTMANQTISVQFAIENFNNKFFLMYNLHYRDDLYDGNVDITADNDVNKGFLTQLVKFTEKVDTTRIRLGHITIYNEYFIIDTNTSGCGLCVRFKSNCDFEIIRQKLIKEFQANESFKKIYDKIKQEVCPVVTSPVTLFDDKLIEEIMPDILATKQAQALKENPQLLDLFSKMILKIQREIGDPKDTQMINQHETEKVDIVNHNVKKANSDKSNIKKTNTGKHDNKKYDNKKLNIDKIDNSKSIIKLEQETPNFTANGQLKLADGDSFSDYIDNVLDALLGDNRKNEIENNERKDTKVSNVKNFDNLILSEMSKMENNERKDKVDNAKNFDNLLLSEMNKMELSNYNNQYPSRESKPGANETNMNNQLFNESKPEYGTKRPEKKRQLSFINNLNGKPLIVDFEYPNYVERQKMFPEKSHNVQNNNVNHTPKIRSSNNDPFSQLLEYSNYVEKEKQTTPLEKVRSKDKLQKSNQTKEYNDTKEYDKESLDLLMKYLDHMETANKQKTFRETPKKSESTNQNNKCCNNSDCYLPFNDNYVIERNVSDNNRTSKNRDNAILKLLFGDNYTKKNNIDYVLNTFN